MVSSIKVLDKERLLVCFRDGELIVAEKIDLIFDKLSIFCYTIIKKRSRAAIRIISILTDNRRQKSTNFDRSLSIF